MQKLFRVFLSFVVFAVLSGCAKTNVEETSKYVPCSAQWFTFVDDVLKTADSEGHGPDIGSSEWKSVVEFKLGIRNYSAVPEPSSKLWCDYIDARISGNDA